MSGADWYVDPTGRHEHRFWGRTSWTAHVVSAGSLSVDEPEVGWPSPAPQNDPVLAYQTFSNYWDTANVAANVAELQANVIEVGIGVVLDRNVDSRDWTLMSDALNILARNAPPSNMPDPYRTLDARFVATLNAYRSAVGSALPAIYANHGGPSYITAIKAAAASDGSYPALAQAVDAMRQRRQGGPVGIVP